MKKLPIVKILFALALVYLFYYTHFMKDEIITAQGIIIRDSLNRDRILIGAPFPGSVDRVRNHSGKADSLWGAYAKNYSDMYDDLIHSGTGILILNEQGFDRVIVGDVLPDPNIGHRIAYFSGMLWNDDFGNELGGVGVNKLKGSGKIRTGIGFDDNNNEAMHMFILEDGSRMLRIASQKHTILIGNVNTPNNSLFANKYPFSGIMVLDPKDSLLIEVNAYSNQ